MELDDTKLLRESIENSMRKVGAMVKRAMQENPATRDSDAELILQVWEYMGVNVESLRGIIDVLPSFESIRRNRQKLQNEKGEYLPTNPEVIRKRNITQVAVTNWARSE